MATILKESLIVDPGRLSWMFRSGVRVCPFVGGVTREYTADVGIQEQRKDDAHGFAGIATKALRMPRRAGQSSAEAGLIVDEVSSDVDKKIEEATKAAQREIDEVTADCPGAVIATEADQSAGFRGCNSPVLDEGKRTGRYVYFDRYSPEQAWQAVLALRASLLPDNYDGSEEGEYAAPPYWIEELRGVDDDES
jgi:hypothetical protein